jgi:hypothetical protein
MENIKDTESTDDKTDNLKSTSENLYIDEDKLNKLRRYIMETIEATEATEDTEDKTEHLKSTSDNLHIDTDELNEIIRKSKDEYNSISSEVHTKSNLPIVLLLAGILILAILIFKTVVQTKDVAELRSNDQKGYTLTIDKNGDTVESHQNPNIGK